MCLVAANGEGSVLRPSCDCSLVSTGSRGKSTTAWLVRGIYEELRKVTGMIGTIEYAITTDKMTADGDLWEPTVEDTTLER